MFSISITAHASSYKDLFLFCLKDINMSLADMPSSLKDLTKADIERMRTFTAEETFIVTLSNGKTYIFKEKGQREVASLAVSKFMNTDFDVPHSEMIEVEGKVYSAMEWTEFPEIKYLTKHSDNPIQGQNIAKVATNEIPPEMIIFDMLIGNGDRGKNGHNYLILTDDVDVNQVYDISSPITIENPKFVAIDNNNSFLHYDLKNFIEYTNQQETYKANLNLSLDGIKQLLEDNPEILQKLKKIDRVALRKELEELFEEQARTDFFFSRLDDLIELAEPKVFNDFDEVTQKFLNENMDMDTEGLLYKRTRVTLDNGKEYFVQAGGKEEVGARVVSEMFGFDLVKPTKLQMIEGKDYAISEVIEYPVVKTKDLFGEETEVGNIAKIAKNEISPELFIFDMLIGKSGRGKKGDGYLIFTESVDTNKAYEVYDIIDIPDAQFVAVNNSNSFYYTGLEEMVKTFKKYDLYTAKDDLSIDLIQQTLKSNPEIVEKLKTVDRPMLKQKLEELELEQRDIDAFFIRLDDLIKLAD